MHLRWSRIQQLGGKDLLFLNVTCWCLILNNGIHIAEQRFSWILNLEMAVNFFYFALTLRFECRWVHQMQVCFILNINSINLANSKCIFADWSTICKYIIHISLRCIDFKMLGFFSMKWFDSMRLKQFEDELNWLNRVEHDFFRTENAFWNGTQFSMLRRWFIWNWDLFDLKWSPIAIVDHLNHAANIRFRAEFSERILPQLIQ